MDTEPPVNDLACLGSSSSSSSDSGSSGSNSSNSQGSLCCDLQCLQATYSAMASFFPELKSLSHAFALPRSRKSHVESAFRRAADWCLPCLVCISSVSLCNFDLLGLFNIRRFA